MIPALTAYTEMILAADSGKSGLQVRKAAEDAASGNSGRTPASAVPDGAGGADALSVDLSVSHDVFSAVDDYFNLGRSGRFEAFHKLSREDKEQFVQIVAELAKAGYIGYEELVVGKKVEKHDVTTRMADERVRSAKVYDRPKVPRR